jgi:F0F1-type ATP synthase membrane subunit b/b'
MPEFLSDPNVYILLSFCCLVYFCFSKLKAKALAFLAGYADSVAKTVDDAKAEKNKALLDLTKANQQALRFQEDVANIWEGCTVDISLLQEGVAKEIEKAEYTGALQFEYAQRLQMQAEYSQCVDHLCQKFKDDVQTCDMHTKEQLLKQAIGLLDLVTLDGPIKTS